MKYRRSYSPSTESYSSRSSRSCSDRSAVYKKNNSQLKSGLRKSVPAAMMVWAFQKLPSKHGLTSRNIIGFLKKYYKVADNPRRTGRALSKMLRFAVEFGLLRKIGTKYYLANTL